MPQEYLAARLKSYGDRDLYDWATFIENYADDYKTTFRKLTQDIKEDPSVIDCLVEDSDQFNKQLSNKFGFWVNFIYTEGTAKFESISLTIKFLERLGYSVEEFVRILLQGGFPRIYCPNANYSQVARTIFKKYFYCDFKKHSFTRNMDLYHANGGLIPTSQECGCAVFPQKNGEIHVQHHLMYDFHVEKEIKDECKMVMLEENVNFVKVRKESEQDTKHFLKNYYGYKSEEDMDVSKICGFHELMDEEHPSTHKLNIQLFQIIVSAFYLVLVMCIVLEIIINFLYLLNISSLCF